MLRGDILTDDSGAYAVFTEQGASTSQMTASKVMDVARGKRFLRLASNRRRRTRKDPEPECVCYHPQQLEVAHSGRERKRRANDILPWYRLVGVVSTSSETEGWKTGLPARVGRHVVRGRQSSPILECAQVTGKAGENDVQEQGGSSSWKDCRLPGVVTHPRLWRATGSSMTTESGSGVAVDRVTGPSSVQFTGTRKDASEPERGPSEELRLRVKSARRVERWSPRVRLTCWTGVPVKSPKILATQYQLTPN